MSKANGHGVARTNTERIAQLEHDVKTLAWLHAELSLAMQLLVLNLAVASQEQQTSELQQARDQLLGR